MRGSIATTALATALLALPTTISAQQTDAQAMARGAQLYGQVCGRCHNARPANERTDREWRTIMLHMRARANLTKSDAGALLVFLQATNGNDRAAAIAESDPELYAALDRYLSRIRTTAASP